MFKIWSPPESPVRIEYPLDLLREIQMQNGILWGARGSGWIRVAAKQCLAGLEPVGKFFARIRGEVFLTESELAELDQMGSPGAIALVIAGTKAGFFVPERDGRMQTVRSYREIELSAYIGVNRRLIIAADECRSTRILPDL